MPRGLSAAFLQGPPLPCAVVVGKLPLPAMVKRLPLPKKYWRITRALTSLMNRLRPSAAVTMPQVRPMQALEPGTGPAALGSRVVGEQATPVPAAVKALLVARSMYLRRSLSAIKVPDAFTATA